MSLRFKYLLLIFFYCNAIHVNAQTGFKIKNIGIPEVETILADEYLHHSQVWDIAQDSDDLMYIATTTGISQFDGKYWKGVTSGSSLSLLYGSDQRMYVGGRRGISVLVKDSTHTYVPKSLLPKLPVEDRNTRSVFDIVEYQGNIVFQTDFVLYFYNMKRDTIEMVRAKKNITSIVSFDDRILAYDLADGLTEYIDGEFLPVINGKSSKHLIVKSMVYQENGTVIMLTKNNGLYQYGSNGLRALSNNSSNYLKGKLGSSMTLLKGGYLAIGTKGNGLIIIDQEGNLIQHLTRSNALASDVVYGFHQDRTGILWVSLNRGVNKIHIQSPFTFIQESAGLKGSYIHAISHKNVLYICGNDGVYRKDLTKPWQSFERSNIFDHYKENQLGNNWIFISKGDDLFCGGENGLFQVKESELQLISNKSVFSVLELSDPNAFIVNGGEKLQLFSKTQGKWQFEKIIKGPLQEYDFLMELPDGQFLGTESSDGLYRIKVDSEMDSIVEMRHYTEEDGLPTTRGNRLYRHSKGVAITTRQGVYELDMSTERVVPNKSYPEVDSVIIFRLPEDPEGNRFLVDVYARFSYLKNAGNDKFTWIEEPFKVLKGTGAEFILPLDEENVIMIRDKRIVHFDPSISSDYAISYQALVRSVSTTTNGDSLFFGGVRNASVPVLEYAENALSFEFSAPFYERSETLLFSYQLIGFDESWSEWSKSTKKEYTNLPQGDFEFRVKTKNIYDYESEQDTFKFAILPPWYFTYSAYAGYFVLFVLFIWSIVKLNTRRLIKEKKALEQVVTERTVEINEQKNSLQKQSKKLQELDKVKSRFFANISHELRTPITLINGPVDAMLKGEYGKVEETLAEGLNVVKNNGRNLSTLVDEILELTKLEAGKLKLTENPVQLFSFMEELIEAYSAEIKSRQIDFVLDYQYRKEVSILIDELKFSKIINNLLSNAFKFTPDHGQIVVAVQEVEANLSISVKDNGSGIHPDDIDYVFERFYQSEQAESKAQGGTGIGLALSQELAKLYHGSIIVNSSLDLGSEFVFTFSPKVVDSNVIEVIADEINVGVIKANLEATISNYINIFDIDNPVLLITEDHKEMRDFIGQIVGKYFSVLQASNGIEALDTLRNNRVDMIISDVMMPKMDGFELLEVIKGDEALQNISMIMLTARAAEEDKLFALTLGVDDYLTKPFSQEELLVRSKNILDNRIIRKIAENEHTTDSEMSPNIDVQFINDLKAFIDKNMSDSLLSVSYLAAEMAMSERQLQRRIKSTTGFSPLQLIKEIKLQRAKKLLENSQVATVAEASYNIGINNVEYFSNQYVSRFGKRPSESLSP